MDQILNQTYKKIIDSEAERITACVVDSCIQTLQAFKRDSGMMQSTDILDNVWDEICVQTQSEYSAMWDCYVDLMNDVVEKALQNITENQRLLLWLQTDEGWEWQYDCENGIVEADLLFDKNGFPTPFDNANVKAFILDEILSRSQDYHSKRIEKFLTKDIKIVK